MFPHSLLRCSFCCSLSYTYTYIYIYTFIYTFIYIYTYKYNYKYTYTYNYKYTYIYIYIFFIYIQRWIFWNLFHNIFGKFLENFFGKFSSFRRGGSIFLRNFWKKFFWINETPPINRWCLLLNLWLAAIENFLENSWIIPPLNAQEIWGTFL